MNVQDAIVRLKQVSDFTPEFIEEDLGLLGGAMSAFLASYPRAQRYADYLEFLRLTGGAFVDSPRFSLAVYGFGGDIVTSFHEQRLFLDRDQYFHFADVVYPEYSDLILVFAFDFLDDSSAVYVSENDIWKYKHCSTSFTQLLLDFANGTLPRLHT